MRGTTAGSVLAQRFTLLSHSITGIFLPAVYSIIGGLEQLIGFFRGHQSPAISRFRDLL